MLFNQKIKINNLKLPPQNNDPKTYHRLYRIIKSKEFIKLLEEKNTDLLNSLVNYNNFISKEELIKIIIFKNFEK